MQPLHEALSGVVSDASSQRVRIKDHLGVDAGEESRLS
jgi:hypothetical protein